METSRNLSTQRAAYDASMRSTSTMVPGPLKKREAAVDEAMLQRLEATLDAHEVIAWRARPSLCSARATSSVVSVPALRWAHVRELVAKHSASEQS